jgi:phage terminase large subunit
MGVQGNFEHTGNKLLNTLSGSDIIFKGLQTSNGDQTANLKSLTGVTTWVLDEAEEQTDEDKFDKIDLSFRKKGTQTRIIIILNPTSKAHWIYKRFFESKGVPEGFTGEVGDTTYIHTTYLDNIDNLDNSFIQRANELKQTYPEKYHHIMLGGWLEKAEGVIIKNWRFGEFDDTLPFYFGSDYGFNPDPDVLVKVAVDSKGKKLYVKEEFRITECSPTDLVQRIKSIVKNNILHAERSEQRINEMLRREGVKVFPTKTYPNSVEDGLKMLQDYEIIVSPESVGIAKEFNNYVEKNGKPLSNGYDHFIDAIRYVVMAISIKTTTHKSKITL